MPLMFFGFETKSWNSFHSPWPVVAPNAAGCRSDMSNRKTDACANASAVLRCNGFEDATAPGTKSPSSTIAAFGELVSTLLTDVLKSVWSAPDLPPGMLPVSPTILAIKPNAVLTDLSVHLILCADSLSYNVGP